jgi:hypothetical protein
METLLGRDFPSSGTGTNGLMKTDWVLKRIPKSVKRFSVKMRVKAKTCAVAP